QLIVNGGQSATTFAEFTKTTPTLELHTLQETVSPRLIRTHLPMDKIRFSDKAKYVYVARNPWDCCVSSFHIMRELPVYEFFDASFDEFLEAFLCGRCGFGDYFDHVLSGFNLKECPNVFFVTYEEILSNKRDVVLKLSQFLGGDYGAILRDNEQVLKQVMEKSELSFMKYLIPSNLDHVLNAHPEVMETLNISRNSSNENADGAVRIARFVRKGDVGDWKLHFSEESTHKMQAMIDKKFAGTGIMNFWPLY
ncbi:unnamed protein product, partial [Ixodes pacificus]